MTALESFTRGEVASAIKSFLDLGEDAGPKAGIRQIHGGYFSGGGWAARALRYHLNQLLEELLQEKKSTFEFNVRIAENGDRTVRVSKEMWPHFLGAIEGGADRLEANVRWSVGELDGS